MKIIETIKNFLSSEPHPLKNARTELIKKMRKLYKFLETEYSYTYTLDTEVDQYPGGPKYYINKYTNLKAQRQIEIVFHRNSDLIYFFIKRLHNNIEPLYSDNENCFTFYEVDIYNGIDNYDRHNPYLPPDYEFNNIKVGLEILKSIPTILKGSEWLSREKLDQLYLENKKGYKSGHFCNSIFTKIVEIFEFLEIEFDFKIIYNYNKLRPFEQDLGGSLVYSNGDLVIGFSVDLRDQYFSLHLLKTNEYHIDNFWQLGQYIYQGKTNEKDLITARRTLVVRLNNYKS